jgi:DNA polymerase III delta prime subunit
MNDLLAWADKYRPHTIEECILPKALKETFLSYVGREDIPNFIFAGGSGIGKTSVAMALLDQLDCDYILVNGTLDGDIETLRTKIQNFASTVSFKGKKKFVIIDEADGMAWKTQPALRNFTETYANNCGFIFTANHLNKIIHALHSRCAVVKFSIPKEEAPAIASKFYQRVLEILKLENIEFDAKAVSEVISRYYPDWRRTLNELQFYAAKGRIDSGILGASQESIGALMGYLKEKNFTEVRRWAAKNLESDYQLLFESFYAGGDAYFKKSYLPEMVLVISKYMTQSAVAFSQEINFVAFCVEIMIGAEWK